MKGLEIPAPALSLSLRELTLPQETLGKEIRIEPFFTVNLFTAANACSKRFNPKT